MRGESVSTYPRRPKAEAFSNTVDVVERLHDPTDPSTKHTALNVTDPLTKLLSQAKHDHSLGVNHTTM